jgi:hypothetical protein
METDVYNDFLQLVRLGIGHWAGPLSANPDWEAIYAQALKHALPAVLVDGINDVRCKRDDVRCEGESHTSAIIHQPSLPPKEQMLQWIGEVLQGFEMPRKIYLQAVASLARFYNAHGYRMMVLKGYACSLNWPRPEHRPCGDIDIWLFGQQQEADAAMEKAIGIEVDTSHHHHTVFNWGGFMVENHYDFVNVHSYRSSRRMERLFKELGAFEQKNENENQNEKLSQKAQKTLKGHGFAHQPVELMGERLWLPSPNLHALFLLRHLGAHFAAIDISLRQLLDWAFFAEKHTGDVRCKTEEVRCEDKSHTSAIIHQPSQEVDWEWLQGVLEEYGMSQFFHCVNAICVEDLGFAGEVFPKGDFDPLLKQRILTDILAPEYPREEPAGFIPKMTYKYRRWQGNAWKQRLVYDDNRFVSFWTGLGEHFFRP